MCLEKYKTLCVKDITERNRMIDWVIDAVRRGIVLYGVYPENLEKEAENGMKVIKIFLQDYREKKRDLPKDLSVLQEYVWKEYGYKLRIFNPWGKPFKYTPQNRDKYFVGSGGNN